MKLQQLKDLVENEKHLCVKVDNRGNTKYSLRLEIQREGRDTYRKHFSLYKKNDTEIYDKVRAVINLRDAILHSYTTEDVAGHNMLPSTEFPFLLISDKGEVYNTRTNHFLSTTLKKGAKYKMVSFQEYDVKRTVRVHILVADAFLGYVRNSRFSNKNITSTTTVVNHIDHDKLNNNLDNLELISNVDNILHSMPRSKSGYRGVHKCRGTFRAKTSVFGTEYSIASDDDPENLSVMYLTSRYYIDQLEKESRIPKVEFEEYTFAA